jgi:2-polyprenyl-3-methyl-5-hydroxy-6-metoxy-1,4-benzoquinol methylase
VIDDDIRRPTTLRSRFDLISCISVIEHIDDPAAAFRSMIKLLVPGGHLVLRCPYNDQWLAAATSAQIVRQEYWRFWSGDVWRQGERCDHPERTSALEPHQLNCILIRRDQ